MTVMSGTAWRVALAAALRCEWRLLRADIGYWLVVALWLASLGYAMYGGVQTAAARSATIAAAEADERARRAAARTERAEIADGRREVPAEAWRDPGNPLSAGGPRGATIAALPPLPLSPLAEGLDDLQPPLVKVSNATPERFLFADELGNPLHRLTGAFDVAFVVVYLLPLWLLALLHNLISSEREDGRLALTLSCAAPASALLAGRLLVRAGLPVLAGLALLSAAMLARVSAREIGTMLVVLLGVLAYALFWILVALRANLSGHGSASNALRLAGLWVMVLLIVPALSRSVVDRLLPAPSRAELVLAIRAATQGADRDQTAALARFRDDHPDAGTKPLPADTMQARLRAQQAALAEADAVLDAHTLRLSRQHDALALAGLLTPALSLHALLADAAGTGRARHDAFIADVRRFHRRWRAHFEALAENGQRVLVDEDVRLPRFDPALVQAPAVRLLPVLGLCLALLLAMLSLLRAPRLSPLAAVDTEQASP